MMEQCHGVEFGKQSQCPYCRVKRSCATAYFKRPEVRKEFIRKANRKNVMAIALIKEYRNKVFNDGNWKI